jgi:hypothetical protein
LWFGGQLITACAEQFNNQRDQILAHLDTSRIGKSYQAKGKSLTYTRKDYLQDLIG